MASPSNCARSRFNGWVALIPLIGPQVQASETMPTRLYTVTTETGMPHLEENLRYTTTRMKRCLAHQRLTTAFPVLTHPALKGCRLDRENRNDDTVSYQLICSGGHGTTGSALWRLAEHQIQGTLQVKLGGKNMTFYQRVTATPLGKCVSDER
jgi:hypothetical protein